MDNPTVLDVVLGERKFLHDIANHIVVAHGMSNFVLRSLKETNTVTEKDIDRLERSIEAINKMTAALKERRVFLHGLSE
jgi:cob(I)alamin adenosyltransferase